mgnify:CR=1 FL=1
MVDKKLGSEWAFSQDYWNELNRMLEREYGDEHEAFFEQDVYWFPYEDFYIGPFWSMDWFNGVARLYLATYTHMHEANGSNLEEVIFDKVLGTYMQGLIYPKRDVTVELTGNTKEDFKALMAETAKVEKLIRKLRKKYLNSGKTAGTERTVAKELEVALQKSFDGFPRLASAKDLLKEVRSLKASLRES